jgi:hypothetical protein
MVCKACLKGVNMRRNLLLLAAWRRVAQRTGEAAAAEPAMKRLWAADAQPYRERGDIFTVLPGKGLVVANVPVVHSGAVT